MVSGSHGPRVFPKDPSCGHRAGFFLTEQNRYLLLTKKGELTERGKQILARTSLRRFGHPEDLLGAVRWLLSEEAAFVTGVVLPIDGGFAAYAGL